MDEFWNFLSEIHGGRILDIACGRGQFTVMLAEKLAGYTHITGLDPDGLALQEATEELGTDKILFLEGSAMNISFPDESFDTVSISRGLHHLEDVPTGLSEMKRVLRKNGLMIIIEMHSDELTPAQRSHLLYHHMKSDLDRMDGITHNHTFSRDAIRLFVEELGLRDLIMRECTEDTDPPLSPVIVEDYLAKTGIWKDRIRELPQKTVLMQEIEKLEERIRKVGISRPPLMVVTGRK